MVGTDVANAWSNTQGLREMAQMNNQRTILREQFAQGLALAAAQNQMQSQRDLMTKGVEMGYLKPSLNPSTGMYDVSNLPSQSVLDQASHLPEGYQGAWKVGPGGNNMGGTVFSPGTLLMRDAAGNIINAGSIPRNSQVVSQVNPFGNALGEMLQEAGIVRSPVYLGKNQPALTGNQPIDYASADEETLHQGVMNLDPNAIFVAKKKGLIKK